MLEAFVIIGSSRNYCMFTLLGVLVMLSDAPFIDDMNIYVSLRVTRRTWFVSKFVYVLMNCMLFYLAVMIATVLLCAPAVESVSRVPLRLTEREISLLKIAASPSDSLPETI